MASDNNGKNFDGFSTQKKLPVGDQREPNCDVWAEVDFGRGPVDVRCTDTGDHDAHVCIVVMTDE